MLGLQYVVNKSKSLTTKLDISGRASSQNTSDQMHQPEAASQVPHTTFSGNEGKEFLAGQAALYQRVLSRHTKLINS
jgi:hypothetical protein